MIDCDKVSDGELVRRVTALDPKLGEQVQARLRRLRLVRVQVANLPKLDWNAAVNGPVLVRAYAGIVAAIKRLRP